MHLEMALPPPAPGKEEKTDRFLMLRTHVLPFFFFFFELGTIKNKAIISILFEKPNTERKPIANKSFWSMSCQDQ